MGLIVKAILLGVLFYIWVNLVANVYYVINPYVPDYAQMTEYTKEILNKGR